MTNSPTNTKEVDAHAAQRLASADLRYTKARQAVVQQLAAARGPVTLPELLNADSSLAKSSVYRILSDLETAGVVVRVPGPGEHGLFELTEELSGHHHHALCKSCGRVVDIEFAAEVEEIVESALAAAARDAGFAVKEHRIDVLGICSDCAGK